MRFSSVRCRLGFGLACFCFSFRTKYVQIPLQSHIILFILWKEFSECNNKRLWECRQRQQQQQQLRFELNPDSLSSYPGDGDAPTCFSVGSTERNALLFRALCLCLNLQVVYTRNWPKLFTNVANVHNAQTTECQCPVEPVLSAIFRLLTASTSLKTRIRLLPANLAMSPSDHLSDSSKVAKRCGYLETSSRPLGTL